VVYEIHTDIKKEQSTFDEKPKRSAALVSTVTWPF